MLIASDAQAEPGTTPTGGYLLHDLQSDRKTGKFVRFDDETLELWGYPKCKLEEGGNPIALCEGGMLPMVMLTEAHRMEHCDVLWFVDNTTALHSVIKGNARNQWLDRSIAIFHFLAFRHDVHVWFEFVDSKSNWADGISRELDKDPFAIKHGYEIGEVSIPRDLWKVTAKELWSCITGK